MRQRHLAVLSLMCVVTTGCGTSKGTPSTCVIEAAPSADSSAPLGGDANGDGHVDVSDGTSLARTLLAGGPAVSCAAAMDLVPDGDVNVGDVLGVWYSLGPKTAPYRPTVTTEDCPEVARTVDPPCASALALDVEAPERVTGTEGAPTTFDTTVRVTSPDLDVEGWSFTLTASGCTLDAGTTAGDAADKADGTGGLRDGGFAWQDVTPTEAHVLTVLDWRTQAALPKDGARPVHTFRVTGTPSASCTSCTLTLTAGDPAAGVETVVSAGGWRYLPTLVSVTIPVCAG